VPLRDGFTPAVLFGRGIELLVSGFGLAALLLSLPRRRRVAAGETASPRGA
jgi:hypothetical protein